MVVDKVTFLTHYMSEKSWYDRHVVSWQAKKFEVALPRNSSILEVGCGSGIDSEYLLSKGHQVIASDIGGYYHRYKCKCEYLPFKKQSFDGVFCRGVLHLCEIDKAIKEIDRVSRLGGIIWISYPITLEKNNIVVDRVPIIDVSGRADVLYKRVSVKKYKDHKHTILQLLFKKYYR